MKNLMLTVGVLLVAGVLGFVLFASNAPRPATSRPSLAVASSPSTTMRAIVAPGTLQIDASKPPGDESAVPIDEATLPPVDATTRSGKTAQSTSPAPAEIAVGQSSPGISGTFAPTRVFVARPNGPLLIVGSLRVDVAMSDGSEAERVDAFLEQDDFCCFDVTPEIFQPLVIDDFQPGSYLLTLHATGYGDVQLRFVIAAGARRGNVHIVMPRVQQPRLQRLPTSLRWIDFESTEQVGPLLSVERAFAAPDGTVVSVKGTLILPGPYLDLYLCDTGGDQGTPPDCAPSGFMVGNLDIESLPGRHSADGGTWIDDAIITGPVKAPPPMPPAL
jgi:hypothetical protein